MPSPGAQRPDRNLAMELARVTESAALAAARWVGRGNKIGADAAAVGKDLQSRIKTMCGVSTRVKVGAPDSIERTLVGKARRVIDRRPKG